MKWKERVVVREMELPVDRECGSKIIRRAGAGRRNQGRAFDVRYRNVVLGMRGTVMGPVSQTPPAP